MPDPLDVMRLPVVPVEPRPEFAAALLQRIEGTAEAPAGQPATMRYFVTDLGAAVVFYRDLLGFEVELRPSPAFAMLYRGDLRLLLSVPGGQGGGGAPMPDGTLPGSRYVRSCSTTRRATWSSCSSRPPATTREPSTRRAEPATTARHPIRGGTP